eukprot:TRINITY_DN2925_c0_g1_i3.p1 TRINITY_DN2925_c0_g1~~TRINITY_DN2925_c0_g1_i3.p1  ORF type:complete len:379 (+),score=9.78 TRINITY_DN2925_c0_g1_i3:59-1138(+)
MLFNLIYDKLLREAHLRGWEILAFADDLAICLKTQNQYLEAVKWLKTWESKTFLEISDDKTKEMRLGRLRGKQSFFEVVPSYKYLGVIVHDNSWKKLSKKRCREIIATQLDLRKAWMNPAVFWWMIAGVLYQLISEVVIGTLSSSYVEKFCLKTLRRATKTANFVSTALLREFYQLNIASTLERMAEKIKMNLGIPSCIRPKHFNRTACIWIQAIKITRLTPAQVATWTRSCIWRKGKPLKCICGEPLSILHAAEHSEAPVRYKLFFKELLEHGINATISKLRTGVEELKNIIKEGMKLMELVNELSEAPEKEDDYEGYYRSLDEVKRTFGDYQQVIVNGPFPKVQKSVREQTTTTTKQ